MMSNYAVSKYNIWTIKKVVHLNKRSYHIIKMWAQPEDERTHCLNENKWWFDYKEFYPHGLDIYRG